LLPAVILLSRLAASGQEAPKQEPPLPLKRVVMFSSSVGFFEHRGEIEGDRRIEFSFKSSDINDLLKSLVVQDQGGGFVTAVNYGSPMPLAQTLRTFAIDLTQKPSLAQIFDQLRGQKVQLEMPVAVTGAVVGVETRKIAIRQAAPLDIQVLNLRTEQGLQSVRIDSISRTQFVDPKVDREFQQALDLLAAARTSDQKQVKLDFRGAGKRNVSVGYIQEAPVWKTSYRLVLADGQAPFLQGWAIVENTTAQDWRDVQLTLVSGRPISFLMDLYEPLYMSRPFVKPEQHASLRPRVYDQDLAGRAVEFESATARAPGGAGRSSMDGGMGGGMGGAMRGGGGMGSAAGYAPARSGRAPLATAVVENLSAIDLQRGVASAASGEDVGELFRYVIQAPVTLDRNESAMLPIVNDAVKGEKVAIYNPAVHAKHPLSGLRLTNTTPLHLLQGPITLFDGSEYAGDARIEDIPPGSTRLISYALDLETEVTVEDKSSDDVIVALQIRKGGLFVKHKAVRDVEYVAKNSSDREKQLLIERPIDTDWTVARPTPAEKTRSLHRFALTAQPGRPATLVVNEETEVTQEIAIANLLPADLELYVHLPAASPALKKALEQVQERKSGLAVIRENRTATESRLTELAADQDRVRKTLQIVPDAGANDPFGEPNRKISRELQQRYLVKLADLENEIEMQRARLQELRQDEHRATRDLEAFLQALVIE